MRQHDAHVAARTEHLLRTIYAALDMVPLNADRSDDTFADWYVCGDELI
jgi:hypothetical protein